MDVFAEGASKLAQSYQVFEICQIEKTVFRDVSFHLPNGDDQHGSQ